MALDMRFFSEQAKAGASDKSVAMFALLQVFVADPEDATDDEDRIPPSMLRAQ